MKRRRLTVLSAVFTLVAWLCTAALPAQTADAKDTCASGERFTGTVADMKHWLTYCKGVPFDVVNNTDTRAATITSYAADGNRVSSQPYSAGMFARRAPGGPSCDWLASTTNGIDEAQHSLVKACYSQGVAHLVCTKWFTGDLYPYHCGPFEAARVIEFDNMVTKQDEFLQKEATACAKGTVRGGITAVIVKVLGGPVGFFASTVGGCLGGAITEAFIG